jgi:hypothetical protein
VETTWEDPPPRERDRWHRIADEMRAHPRRWRVITEVNPRSTRAYGSHIRNGGLGPFQPAGEFEADTRGGVLRARYVGPHQHESGGPVTP